MTTDADTTRIILDQLAAEHPSHRWAFAREVPHTTDHSASPRRIDAVALDLRTGAWHGYEVKASRADWMNETRKKTRATSAPCDFYCIVTPPNVAQADEVDPSIGLMHHLGEGDALHRVRAPRQLQRLQDPLFVPAFVRACAAELKPEGWQELLEAEVQDALKAGERRAQRKADRSLVIAEQRAKRASDTLRAWDRAIGAKLEDLDPVKLGPAFRSAYLMRSSLQGMEEAVRLAKDHFSDTLKNVSEALEQVEYVGRLAEEGVRNRPKP